MASFDVNNMAPYECCHMVTLYISTWQHCVMPCGNICIMPRVNTLLCDKMVGTHPCPPYIVYTRIHHQVYEFMYISCLSLNPRSHGGIQMP